MSIVRSVSCLALCGSLLTRLSFFPPLPYSCQKLLFPLPHLHLHAVSPALTADLLLKYLDIRLQAPLRNCAVTLTVNKSMGQVQTPVEMYKRKQVHLEATGRDLEAGVLQKEKNGMQMYAQP